MARVRNQEPQAQATATPTQPGTRSTRPNYRTPRPCHTQATTSSSHTRANSSTPGRTPLHSTTPAPSSRLKATAMGTATVRASADLLTPGQVTHTARIAVVLPRLCPAGMLPSTITLPPLVTHTRTRTPTQCRARPRAATPCRMRKPSPKPSLTNTLHPSRISTPRPSNTPPRSSTLPRTPTRTPGSRCPRNPSRHTLLPTALPRSRQRHLRRTWHLPPNTCPKELASHTPHHQRRHTLNPLHRRALTSPTLLRRIISQRQPSRLRYRRPSRPP